MIFPDIIFSDTMNVVLEAIWSLRSSTGMTKFRQLKVMEVTKDFTDDGKVVGRQNWAAKDADEIWKAIKKAIAGKLPKDHPVELQIATFGKSDKAGLFLAQREKMCAEVEQLKASLSEEQARHAEFKQLVEQEQYLKGHEEVNYTKRREERFNSQKELGTLRTTLQATQREVDRLASENRTLQKHAGSTGVVEGAKNRLYEPAISELADVLDEKELQNKYAACVFEELERLKTRAGRSPDVNDVVIIFHTFNINIAEFVRDRVAFRHLDGNLVFACFLWNPEKRRKLFKEIKGLLTPFTPRVIIVWGEAAESPQAANVIPMKPVNPDLHKRLQNMACFYRPTLNYDPVGEYYEDVRIMRVGND